MRIFICHFFLFSCLFIKAEIIQKHKDSLDNKSYEELQELYFINQKKIDLAKKYASYFVEKGKRDRNKIKIADGYHLHFMISTPEIAMKYVDSIIELTKNENHFNYPSRGYLNKGVLLQNSKNLNKAFEYYLKAKRHAEDNNNNIHLVAATLNIAQLKMVIGKEKEALKVFKSNYDFLKEKGSNGKFFRPYIGTLIGLSYLYNQQKQPDSSRIYVDEGLEKISNNKEKHGYSALLLHSGISDYHNNNFQRAIDSLEKILSTSWQLEHSLNLAETNLYLAKAYQKINEHEISLKHLKKVNDIIDSTNYTPNTREAFEMLLTKYKKDNDVREQLRVLEKMIFLDSIANSKNNKLNIDMYQKYDTKKLRDEKNILLNGLKKQQNNNWIISILLIITTLGFAYFLYQNYSKRIYYKKRFDLLMQKIDSEPNSTVKNKNITKYTNTIDLPEEVIEEILEKVEAFEQKKKFIDNNITLAKLAKKINTNSTYLSKVINHYKGQNFANYLNDLRIDYAIDQIKNNDNFRKYTIKSIGEEVGFNNVQSFSKAFLKRTGIKPSYFIKQIENQSSRVV
ncbi:helix-turn-helix transcriptional regulator [Aquimarina mytili]|uniref:Helix-turn-helix domain-containing protein n=1 Tax=Aquimarina mytili TaxID=874423 RepID=A0A937DB93_9FLAO|nr:helix-turn-helix transcriptional regulator [Aquimarina mytili]MBL0683576.1 helix-turn-helix domain-containing protein [Aquimarina mytili]